MQHAKLHGIEVMRPGNDGHEAMAVLERQWWQSRMVSNGVVPEPPEIVHPVEIVKQMMAS